MIESDLTKLEDLYRRGMRVMTLTWNNSTDWAKAQWTKPCMPTALSKRAQRFWTADRTADERAGHYRRFVAHRGTNLL